MSQEPFGEIPLFRELQKLLSSGGGPLNTEIATQVALALATEGRSSPTPDPAAARAFDEALHEAEMMLSGYTRIDISEPAVTETIGRADWVRSTLSSWSWIFERLSARFTSAAQGFGAEEGGGAGPAGAQAVIGQLAPLLLGLQVGTLLGHLGKEVLTRYDLPIPRDDRGALFLVDENAQRVADDYGFDPAQFRRWLALREASRHLAVAAHPWVERYFRSLLGDLIDAIEIDMTQLEGRLSELQTRGPEALQEGFGGGDAFPIASTERHRKAEERLQSFITVFEGYASHAAGQVSPALVPDGGRIDEGMARLAASPSEGRTALVGILGLEITRSMYAAGATFCAAVVKLRGMSELNQVWAAPDNLPTSEEIKDPFAWMERVLSS